MKTPGLVMIAALALHGAATAQFDRSGESTVDLVVTKERGLLLGLDDVIVGGIVLHFAVSPDDRYIAVLRMDDPHRELLFTDPAGKKAPIEPGLEILIWDELDKKLTHAADLGKGRISPREFKWLSDGSAVVMQTVRHGLTPVGGGQMPVQTFRTVTVNPRTGRATYRNWKADGGNMLAAVSPIRPVIVEIAFDYGIPVPGGDGRNIVQTIRLTSLDRDGNVNAQKTIKLEDRGFAGDWKWSQDGRSLLLQTKTSATRTVRSQRSVFVVDPMTLDYQETSQGLETYSAPANAFDAALVTEPVAVERGGKSAMRIATWMEGDPESFSPRALVSIAPRPAQLSPRGRFLVYAQANALVIRRITPVDRKTLEEARAAAIRTAQTSTAKQLAIGLMMFASDHEGELPYPDSFRRDVLPYLRNKDLFEGFVYSYSGGALNALEDPSNTEFGYIPVDGGRIVAFADGHVQFIKDDD